MAIVKHDTQPTSAKDIKNALCRYFYTKRHCIYFCKEHYLNRYNMRADFIALFQKCIDGKVVKVAMEIEVKISWNDFLRDFKDKKIKHEEYTGKIGQPPLVNYFAFCVPVEIYERCKEYLDKNYPQYGLFIYGGGDICQGRGSMFSEKRLLTKQETPITRDEIAQQMAIHILYS